MTGLVLVVAAAALAQPQPAPAPSADRISKLEARVAAGQAQCADYQQLARLYRGRGDFELGLATIRRCTALAPEDPAAHLAVANYLSEEANALRAHAMSLERGRTAPGGYAQPSPSGCRPTTEAMLAGPPPVRVGGNIKAPVKRKHVNPAFPPEAQEARVSGVVILEATIGSDGRVEAACVLRSIPLLDQAAVDAVRQWEFEPTLLNGQPVPIIMTVTVNFTLM